VQEINGPGEWPVLFFGDTFYRHLALAESSIAARRPADNSVAATVSQIRNASSQEIPYG
jgi:hypothetical protein